MTHSPRSLQELQHDLNSLAQRIGHPSVAAQEFSLFEMMEKIGQAVVGMSRRLDTHFTTLDLNMRQTNLQLSNLRAELGKKDIEERERIDKLRGDILKLKSAVILIAGKADLDPEAILRESGFTPDDTSMMEELEKLAKS